ncbi:MAG: hypothetical protein MUC96_32040 [Myxococcaceae bacterium]|jgi:hypothetical protein|nr:hypothetical protein [Myxococcaceae bacterium]
MSLGRWATRLGVTLAAAGATLPLRHPFPAITDFPEHAATIATVHDVLFAGPLADWYRLDFVHTQYWLMAVLGALLSPLAGGAVPALTLLLVASVVGTVVALMRLLHVLELDERLALVAVALVWTRPMTLGFVPFLLATPLVLLALAEVGHPTRTRGWLVATLGLGTFFLNLASVVWLGLGALALGLSLEASTGPWRALPRRLLPRLWGVGVLAFPLLGWALFSDVTNVDASRFTVSMRGQWWSPLRLLREAPGWLLDRWHLEQDRWWLWGLALACVVLALPMGEKESSSGRRPALALAAATLTLCLALPFERGWLWGLSARFLPVAAMLLAVALPSRRGLVRTVGLALVAVVSAGVTWLADDRFGAAQPELQGAELLRGLPSSARVLQLSFDENSAVTLDAATPHLVAYHRAWNGGANEPSFVDLPQSVVRYRDGKAPYLRPWPWEFEPNGYDNEKEGPHSDFVLVRGEGASFPPAEGTPGPRWRLFRERAGWRLFERRHDG